MTTMMLLCFSAMFPYTPCDSSMCSRDCKAAPSACRPSRRVVSRAGVVSCRVVRHATLFNRLKQGLRDKLYLLLRGLFARFRPVRGFSFHGLFLSLSNNGMALETAGSAGGVNRIGLILSTAYQVGSRKSEQVSQPFAWLFPIMPPLISVLIFMVEDNFLRAVYLLGATTLIRFQESG